MNNYILNLLLSLIIKEEAKSRIRVAIRKIMRVDKFRIILEFEKPLVSVSSTKF